MGSDESTLAQPFALTMEPRVAWLPMYLHDTDVEVLVAHLDGDDELAWLAEVAPRRWIAQAVHPPLTRNQYGLWHVPSGPLPLVGKQGAEEGKVTSPWVGWVERRRGANPDVPYFGPGHPGAYWLNLRIGSDVGSDRTYIRLSSFEWIGNHYRMIGSPATKATELHWKALRRWVSRIATRIPREHDPAQRPEIYAFPAALAAIEEGATRVIE